MSGAAAPASSRARAGRPLARALRGALRGALSAALLAACARATPVAGVEGEEAPRQPRRVTVVVHNNLRRPATIRVFIQPRHGDPTLLGTVLAEDTESFTYTPAAPSGEYVLYAESSLGGRVISNGFPMGRTAIVRWELFSNIATTTVLEDVSEP